MLHKITYPWLEDKCICILLILSMFSVFKIKIAGFPLYSLLLLAIISIWLLLKMLYAGRDGVPFPAIRYLTDTVAITAILYAILSVIVKLFSTSEEGWIDFSWNAEMIALAVICLLVSSGVQFKTFYMDLLLYCGLLVAGVYLLCSLTDGLRNSVMEAFLADRVQVSSYFLLISMISVYEYCACRDQMRFIFYMMVSAISFFVLFLNQDVISLWLMGIYFLMIPVALRPTAVLVKRSMQLFFIYLFMLSNMSLLTEYTQIIRAEISYSLEYSVYMDLLIAAGGVAFFYYWDRIPEGVDLNRLVLKKMQKGYRFIASMVLIVFAAIVIDDGWAALSEGMSYDMVRFLAVPLAEAVGHSKSGILQCFQEIGVLPGIFLIVSMVLFMGRLRRNYAPDRPAVNILILISVVFMIQLLFWNPGIYNIVCYFYLLLTACFWQKE